MTASSLNRLPACGKVESQTHVEFIRNIPRPCP